MRGLFLALLLLLAGCEQNDSHVVYAFTWSQCIPCQADKPRLEQLRESGVSVVVIEYDDSPDIFAQYAVDLTPFYIVYSQGQEVSRTAYLDQIKF